MTPSELKQLANDGIEIAAFTELHIGKDNARVRHGIELIEGLFRRIGAAEIGEQQAGGVVRVDA